MSSKGPFQGCRAETIVSRQAAVERAIAAMQETIDQPMSLKSIARKTLVSPSHLDHVFRQLTGTSPRQFMGALRLQKAKRLLLTTRAKVIDACLDAGYNSPGTFTYRFADLVGASPVQLRKLAECGVLQRMHRLKNLIPNTVADSQSGVRGEIHAPAPFEGLIFIGLFTGPIPQGRPAACIVLTEPGAFTISPAPDGDYCIFAVAFPRSDHILSYFDNETALRASAHPGMVRVRHGRTPIDVQLELRPPGPADPPILVAIPALVGEPPDAAAAPQYGLVKAASAG